MILLVTVYGTPVPAAYLLCDKKKDSAGKKQHVCHAGVMLCFMYTAVCCCTGTSYIVQIPAVLLYYRVYYSSSADHKGNVATINRHAPKMYKQPHTTCVYIRTMHTHVPFRDVMGPLRS